MRVDKQIVIITGGASGMGAACAKALAHHGAKVALLDVNLQEAEKVAASINGLAFKCDVTDSQSITKALDALEKTWGIPRVCVNCAGIVHARRLINKEGPMPLEDFSRVLTINLTGTFNMLRLSAERMQRLESIGQSGERGVIINTASVAAFEGQIGQVAYSASKGGIVGLTLPAARELAKFGIRVMTIAPGLVDTPMFAQLSPEAKEALTSSVPFPKRLAHPEEFAHLVMQIIENTMLNGSVIRLDGALRLQ